jgi:nucleoside-diphosphate-sugar epimerase
MTTVAVTGATGFIGTCLVDHLVDAGYQVRALTRRPLPERPKVGWVVGDLGDERSLTVLIDGADAVVHCAGVVRGASRHDFDPINVAGTASLARLCAGRLRFLHLSSLAARQPTVSFYAGSKAASEAALGEIDALDYTIFRPPAVYGPADKELKPLLDLMSRGVGVFPDQPGRFALIYVDDLVGAIMAWLSEQGASLTGQCFELDDGSGGYNWTEVIAAMEAVTGRRIRKVAVPRSLLLVPAWLNQAAARIGIGSPMLTPGKVRELYFPDWSVAGDRACRSLGWRPAVSLGVGLAHTLGLVPAGVAT